MLTPVIVDTEQVAAADRFGMWLEMVARTAAPLRIHTAHAHDFTARAEFIDLGPIQVVRYQYPSLDCFRTPKLVRQSDPEVHLLALNTAGSTSATQDDRCSTGRAGDFTFYDGSRPHEVHHHGDDAGREPASSIAALIPHTALPLPPQRLAPLFGGGMSGRTGVGALLAQFLTQVATHPEQYHAADAARLGTIGLDLATTLLGRHLVSEHAIPSEVRRRALVTQVRAYVQQHLDDATLHPQTIADAHHISLRSLHRLFEAEETTVASYIRGLRLERCRHDLADAALRAQPIQTIAARWGFPDKAHFSRMFRAAYGITPQSWRQASRD
ncbi:helix-turn-helix domain-containing protein [Micromonospora sp. WMMC415]|uniref:AraC-like ligand-binding domain-containing protein n=1 Tax=Micromonospora sp. WMMC415 TaxID=2675222 RepID=UPI0012B4A723|nr:helix-turn-helix domain-containing protein [Micromonospora sp. WMMC415]QGN49460.1 helix-turn-helix domain-containing protein [Micromonospora sp. WMMC415]